MATLSASGWILSTFEGIVASVRAVWEQFSPKEEFDAAIMFGVGTVLSFKTCIRKKKLIRAVWMTGWP